MAVWVDPFTGRPVESDVAPLGGPYPAIPGGWGVYQGDPSDFGAAGMLPYGEGNPLAIQIGPGGTSDVDLTFSGGYGFAPDRGTVFYFPGDEWRIIQSYGDLEALQDVLDSMGLITGDYIRGAPDDKTAAAMKKVLEAANASGLSWEQVLQRGLDSAAQLAARRGGGGGGGGRGGGVAAITDEDITAIANEMARDVLGRKLNDEEIGRFIPAFRGAIAGGTSPTTSAENLIRQDIAPTEASAHDIGGVMQAVTRLLGG
jgi:hypothetical protein